MRDTADRILQRFRAAPSVRVTLYSWNHDHAPDAADVIGEGSLVMPLGPGHVDVALITRRMLDRAERRAQKLSVREIVQAMASPSRVQLTVSDTELAAPDPRWFIEILRGVDGEAPASLERPEVAVDWTGRANLLRAQSRSQHQLSLPLGHVQRLPGHPARRRAARAKVRLQTSSCRTAIAVEQQFGLTGPVSWNAVTLEAEG